MDCALAVTMDREEGSWLITFLAYGNPLAWTIKAPGHCRAH